MHDVVASGSHEGRPSRRRRRPQHIDDCAVQPGVPLRHGARRSHPHLEGVAARFGRGPRCGRCSGVVLKHLPRPGGFVAEPVAVLERGGTARGGDGPCPGVTDDES